MNDCTVNTNQFVSEWSDVCYPELSVMLAWLRALYFTHQTNHWTSKADPFYSDHLLFQRLYEEVLPEIDAVAEKSVGVGSEANVELQRQLLTASKITSRSASIGGIPMPNDLVEMSLKLEREFLCVCELLRGSMKNNGTLSTGIDNLTAGIADLHEAHVYLLSQRCGKSCKTVDNMKSGPGRLITYADIGLPERMSDEWKSNNM